MLAGSGFILEDFTLTATGTPKELRLIKFSTWESPKIRN
jgi:hypothetical protein